MRRGLVIWGTSLAVLLAGTASAQPTPPAAAPPGQPVQTGRMPVLKPARVWASVDGSVIYLVGSIGPGTFTEFMRVARTNPKARTLFLASNGGMVVDGYLISNAVRARGMDTWTEWLCASSCTLIFAAGQRRILGRGARLGFHQTFFENAQTGEMVGTDYAKEGAVADAIHSGDRFDPTGPGDDKTVRALRRANVSDAFIAKVLRTPPQQLWYPEPDELQREGMITDLASEQSGLRMPLATYSREDLELTMTGVPFWRALREHEPGLFADAADRIFPEINSGVERGTSEQEAKFAAFDKLADRLVNAGDLVLSRFLSANAKVAASQRQRGYPRCEDPLAPNGDDPELDQRNSDFEDAYRALLDDFFKVPAMSRDDADKFVRSNRKRLLATGVDFSETGSGAAYQCRVGYRVEEAVDRLEPKYRIPLYRAMLVISGGK